MKYIFEHPCSIRPDVLNITPASSLPITATTTPPKVPSSSTLLDGNSTSIPPDVLNITPASGMPITATTTPSTAPSSLTLLAVNSTSVASEYLWPTVTHLISSALSPQRMIPIFCIPSFWCKLKRYLRHSFHTFMQCI